jgi:hypothetical protein
MNRTFRIIKLIFLVVGILLLIAIPATGLISAALNWKGFCNGFTDGQSPCSWWEFARNEMFWAMFIFIPFFLLAALAWMGMSLAQFINGIAKKRHKKT